MIGVDIRWSHDSQVLRILKCRRNRFRINHGKSERVLNLPPPLPSAVCKGGPPSFSFYKQSLTPWRLTFAITSRTFLATMTKEMFVSFVILAFLHLVSACNITGINNSVIISLNSILIARIRHILMTFELPLLTLTPSMPSRLTVPPAHQPI